MKLVVHYRSGCQIITTSACEPRRSANEVVYEARDFGLHEDGNVLVIQCVTDTAYIPIDRLDGWKTVS